MKARFWYRWSWLLLFHLAVAGVAQPPQPQVRLSFEQDSVALGERVELTFEVTHDPKTQVLFPSRRKDFLPFDFVRSQQPTQEQVGERVRESLVYEIRTFDLASRQAVTLPYQYQSEADTINAQVRSDSVILAERILELSDTLKYRLAPNLYDLVKEEDHSLIWLAGVGGLLALGLLIWILRRPVAYLLARRNLLTEWQQVRRQVQRLEKVEDQRHLFDELSRLWKHWMDPEDRFGLPSMTTTELESRLPQLAHLTPGQRAILLQASRDADRTIYAGQQLDRPTILQLIHSLVEVMQIEYKRRDKLVRRRHKPHLDERSGV